MASTYMFNVGGVAPDIQLGRNGGHLAWDSGTATHRLYLADGSTLGNLRISTNPVDANDAASKTYVDSLVAGLSPKDAVRVATTVAGTLATSFAAGSTIDGVVLVLADRILIKNQASTVENGIYDVTAGAPTRSLDADISTDLGAAFVFVMEGTVGAGGGWVTSFTDTQTIGVDPVAWSQFSAAGAYTASNGIQLSGSDIQLDINSLSGVTGLVGADEVVAYDTSGSVYVKRTWTNVISDLGITTDASLVGGTGINVTGTTIALDNSGLVDTATVAADTIAIYDTSAASVPITRSWTNIISDLGIKTGTVGVTEGGTGLTTIPAFSVMVANTADTITALTATDTGGNQLMQWNDTTNLYEFVTTASVGGNSFETISITGNTAGDLSVIADQVSDTLTLSGGAGVLMTGTALTDTLAISLTATGLTDTTVAGADIVPFFDASSASAPASRTWTNILADLDIVNGITTNGFTVRTAADTYTSRTITASTTASEEGIVITNGDGIAANPTVGLDITGLVADTATAATDEFAYYNGTNNVKIDRDSLAVELFGAANGVRVIETSGALITSTIGAIPANARVMRIRVIIDTIYDNAPDLRVRATTGGVLMSEVQIADNVAGVYEMNIDYRNATGAAENIDFQVLTNVPTVGAARIFVEYYMNSGI